MFDMQEGDTSSLATAANPKPREPGQTLRSDAHPNAGIYMPAPWRRQHQAFQTLTTSIVSRLHHVCVF